MELTSEQRENRIKWAEALESSEYKQGHGSLGSRTACCCLGVACLAVLGHERDEDGIVINSIGGTGALSAIDREKLGIDSEEMFALISMNDSFRASFSDIAQVVRSDNIHAAIMNFRQGIAREANQDHQDR